MAKETAPAGAISWGRSCGCQRGSVGTSYKSSRLSMVPIGCCIRRAPAGSRNDPNSFAALLHRRLWPALHLDRLFNRGASIDDQEGAAGRSTGLYSLRDNFQPVGLAVWTTSHSTPYIETIIPIAGALERSVLAPFVSTSLITVERVRMRKVLFATAIAMLLAATSVGSSFAQGGGGAGGAGAGAGGAGAGGGAGGGTARSGGTAGSSDAATTGAAGGTDCGPTTSGGKRTTNCAPTTKR